MYADKLFGPLFRRPGNDPTESGHLAILFHALAGVEAKADGRTEGHTEAVRHVHHASEGLGDCMRNDHAGCAKRGTGQSRRQGQRFAGLGIVRIFYRPGKVFDYQPDGPAGQG